MPKSVLLARHPDTPSEAMTLPVWVGRSGAMFRATFRIPGNTDALLLPAKLDSEIRDGPLGA